MLKESRAFHRSNRSPRVRLSTVINTSEAGASVPTDRRPVIRLVGGTNTRGIRLIGVGRFSGHFIESDEYTCFLLM